MNRNRGMSRKTYRRGAIRVLAGTTAAMCAFTTLSTGALLPGNPVQMMSVEASEQHPEKQEYSYFDFAYGSQPAVYQARVEPVSAERDCYTQDWKITFNQFGVDGQSDGSGHDSSNLYTIQLSRDL